MKIGIVYKSESKKAQELFFQIKDYLKTKGHELVGEKKLKEAKYIISLGGDGTLIHKACEHTHFKIPFIGINTGNLGFLTASDAGDWKTAVDHLISGKEVFVSERMMLDIKVGKDIFRAVNEAVVKGLYRIVDLKLTVNSEPFLKVLGDGVIISTQTGSTAYSLSSGGPIIDPEVDCLLITPVNPTGLPIPSVVLSPKDEITIKVIGGSDISLVVDGQVHTKLEVGQELFFKRGLHNVMLGYFEKEQFLKALNAKFGLASRASG